MAELLRCKSCGSTFSGNYCNTCGEKVIRAQDRRLKYFIGELINALTFADSKLWRSLKILLLSPGKLSKNYVEGIRQQWMKPLAIFFLANLLYFLFPFVNTFTTTLDLQLSAFPYSDLATVWVENRIAQQEITLDVYREVYDRKTAELSKLLLILMAPVLTLFFSVIHFDSKKNLVADHITLSLELMGFILLFNVQLMSLLLIGLGLINENLRFLLNNFWLTALSVVLLAYFCARMQATFYEYRGARLIVNTLLCIAAISIALSLYRALLFFFTFWVT